MDGGGASVPIVPGAAECPRGSDLRMAVMSSRCSPGQCPHTCWRPKFNSTRVKISRSHPPYEGSNHIVILCCERFTFTDLCQADCTYHHSVYYSTTHTFWIRGWACDSSHERSWSQTHLLHPFAKNWFSLRQNHHSRDVDFWGTSVLPYTWRRYLRLKNKED